MELNLQLINNNDLNCIEKTFASVAHYYNMEYELIFRKRYKSLFSISNEKDVLFENVINDNYYNAIVSDMEMLYGIKKNVIMISNDIDYTLTVKKLISDGIPISISFNQYYLPWANNIQKESKYANRGYLLIKGTSNEYWNCIDIHNKIDYCKLPILNILKEFDIEGEKYISTFTYTKKDKPNFISLFSQLNNDYKTDSNFNDQLNILLKRIKRLEINELITDFNKYIDTYAFIHNIKTIVRNKKLFLLSLYNMKNNSSNIDLEIFINIYEKAVESWQISFGLLLKGYYRKCLDKSLNNKIIDNMMNALDNEKKAIKLHNFNQLNSIHDNNKYSVDINLDNIVVFEPLDISILYNNTWLSKHYLEDYDLECKDMREFYIIDTFFIEKVKKLNLILLLKQIENGFYDNITCQNQTIRVNNDNIYSYITFIGFSEYEDYVVEFIIEYTDGEVQTINTKMPNFYRISDTECNIFWIESSYRKFVMYNKSCMLQKNSRIKSIKFPNVNLVHIIGIIVSN